MELADKLSPVKAESDKRRDELSATTGALVRLDGLMGSVVEQSVEALVLSVYQVSTELMDRFCAELKVQYSTNQLLCSCTLAYTCGVGETSDHVQDRGQNDVYSSCLDYPNSSTASFSKPATAPAKVLHCRASTRIRYKFA